MSKIGILGTGTWGIALGRMLANTGHDVMMWSAIEKEIEELSLTYIHPKLPDMIILGRFNLQKVLKKSVKIGMYLYLLFHLFL